MLKAKMINKTRSTNDFIGVIASRLFTILKTVKYSKNLSKIFEYASKDDIFIFLL